MQIYFVATLPTLVVVQGRYRGDNTSNLSASLLKICLLVWKGLKGVVGEFSCVSDLKYNIVWEQMVLPWEFNEEEWRPIQDCWPWSEVQGK